MMRVIRRHTIEPIFQMIRIVVNYREGQKQFEKTALHLKSTLAKPTIYDRAYCDKIWTSSPSIPVTFTKRRSLLLILQPDKSRKIKRKPISCLSSAINPMQKFTRSQNLHQKSLLYTLLKLFFNSSDMQAELAKL